MEQLVLRNRCSAHNLWNAKQMILDYQVTRGNGIRQHEIQRGKNCQGQWQD